MPNGWQIGNLTIAGVIMGIGELVFCTATLAFGAYRLGLPISALQTLGFVAVVFGNQAERAVLDWLKVDPVLNPLAPTWEWLSRMARYAVAFVTTVVVAAVS